MRPKARDRRRLYRDLAWTWPIISPPEDFVGEAESALALIRAHARIPVATLLHLGCGGGHLDRTFKAHVRVTGVDVSNPMLGLARTLNPEVTYLRGDMRTARFPERFDAVAVFDSINYMLSLDDLRASFETAFAHLRPGGVFLTSAEATREQFDPARMSVTKRFRDGIEITLIESSSDADLEDSTYETFLVFLIRREGRLEVEVDRHLCGIFPRADWIRLLREVGFEASEEHPAEHGHSDEDVPWFVGVKPH